MGWEEGERSVGVGWGLEAGVKLPWGVVMTLGVVDWACIGGSLQQCSLPAVSGDLLPMHAVVQMHCFYMPGCLHLASTMHVAGWTCSLLRALE